MAHQFIIFLFTFIHLSNSFLIDTNKEKPIQHRVTINVRGNDFESQKVRNRLIDDLNRDTALLKLLLSKDRQDKKTLNRVPRSIVDWKQKAHADLKGIKLAKNDFVTSLPASYRVVENKPNQIEVHSSSNSNPLKLQLNKNEERPRHKRWAIGIPKDGAVSETAEKELFNAKMRKAENKVLQEIDDLPMLDDSLVASSAVKAERPFNNDSVKDEGEEEPYHDALMEMITRTGLTFVPRNGNMYAMIKEPLTKEMVETLRHKEKEAKRNATVTQQHDSNNNATAKLEDKPGNKTVSDDKESVSDTNTTTASSCDSKTVEKDQTKKDETLLHQDNNNNRTNATDDILSGAANSSSSQDTNNNDYMADDDLDIVPHASRVKLKKKFMQTTHHRPIKNNNEKKDDTSEEEEEEEDSNASNDASA